MISLQDIIQIGRTQKPHGIKGELNIVFHIEEYAEIDCEYYFLMIDNIPVPFFVEEITFISNNAARVKFDDVEDEKRAAEFINIDVYVPRSIVNKPEEKNFDSWSFFVGYKVVGSDGEQVGTIVRVDNSTINVLFILENEEREILIPATEDFIIAIDENGKIIEMDLPEGLLEE